MKAGRGRAAGKPAKGAKRKRADAEVENRGPAKKRTLITSRKETQARKAVQAPREEAAEGPEWADRQIWCRGDPQCIIHCTQAHE